MGSIKDRAIFKPMTLRDKMRWDALAEEAKASLRAKYPDHADKESMDFAMSSRESYIFATAIPLIQASWAAKEGAPTADQLLDLDYGELLDLIDMAYEANPWADPLPRKKPPEPDPSDPTAADSSAGSANA